MVLPLSIFPSSPPLTHVGLWAVDVVLPGLTPGSAPPVRELPAAGGANETDASEALIRTDGLSVHTRERVERAQAVVTTDPAHLVVDVVLKERASAPPAARVRPSGAPRFGVHERRHRTVVPLSAPPPAKPVARPGVWTVDVAIAGFDPGADRAGGRGHARLHRPARGSENARVIREAVLAPGGVSLRLHVPVGGVRAFVLSGPPRLVIDVEPGTMEVAARRLAEERARTEPDPEAGATAALDATAVAPATRASPGPTEAARPLRLDAVAGYTMLWPDLDAAWYAVTAADPATDALLATGRRLAGPFRGRGAAEITVPLAPGVDAAAADAGAPLPEDAPPAAHALAADLAYVRAAEGDGDFSAAVALYRRALRLAPEFPDTGRVGLMLAFAQLAQGLAPEAEGDFERLARATGDGDVCALALFGAGRAARAAGRHRRAARQLRRAIAADPRSHGACHARSALAVIMAEVHRNEPALALVDEMRHDCPAGILAEPAAIIDQSAVLVAAGRLPEAGRLLAELPALEGELWVRRRFLEAEVAADERLDVARGAYDEVRRDARLPERVRAEATLRLADLEDRAERPDRARALLRRLANRRHGPATRARARVLEAEQLARRGRYPEAIELLAEADAMGPAGFALADRARAWIFRAWMRALAGRGDETEILTVFYRYRGDGIGRLLAPDGVVRVAAAASAVGLDALAVEILAPVHARLRDDARVEARRLLAAAAVARGEHTHALRLTEETRGPAETRAAMMRLRADALLGLGRVDEAAAVLDRLGTREALVRLGKRRLRGGTDSARIPDALTRALVTTGRDVTTPREAVLDGWLALAHAASEAGDPQLETEALRAALALGPGPAGVHYRLAEVAATGAGPGEAAATYVSAAHNESDALFKRAAAAGAAYYEAVRGTGAAR
jgi:tetratricopeptide (TPR) repeat protein